eukprot:GEMP01064546.1.p1 GENE.GEMP01064546.1~~GEMP01064546.1.p1  ORF type:complete len:138 (+),score=16.17 GEMP01064546.1:95-508(+)
MIRNGACDAPILDNSMFKDPSTPIFNEFLRNCDRYYDPTFLRRSRPEDTLCAARFPRYKSETRSPFPLSNRKGADPECNCSPFFPERNGMRLPEIGLKRSSSTGLLDAPTVKVLRHAGIYSGFVGKNGLAPYFARRI